MPISWWTSTPTASTTTWLTSSVTSTPTSASTLDDYTSTTGGTVYWWTDATTNDQTTDGSDQLAVQRAFLRLLQQEQQSLTQQGLGLQQLSIEQRWRQQTLAQYGQSLQQITADEYRRAMQGDLQAPNVSRNVAADVERAAANERAEQLLLDRLSVEQLATYTKNGWFVVKGGKSGESYRIRKGDGTLVANIDRLSNKGVVLHRLCAHAHHHLMPLGDHLYAQMLNIEHDEEEFLRVANVHR